MTINRKKLVPVSQVFDFINYACQSSSAEVSKTLVDMTGLISELQAKYSAPHNYSNKPKSTHFSRASSLLRGQKKYNGIVSIFYRRGLASKAHSLFITFLTIFFKHWHNKLGKSRRIIKPNFNALFKLVNQAVVSLSLPLKLVPRFIKKRVRKFPKIVEPKFQQNRIWRMLRSFGRIAYGNAASNMAEEVFKILQKQRTSVVFTKMPKYYEEIDRSKVYLRKAHAKSWDYNRAYAFVRALVVRTQPYKNRFNKYYLKMLTFARLAQESRADRFTLSKHLKLRTKIYSNKLLRPMLLKFFSFLYGYSRTVRITRHA